MDRVEPSQIFRLLNVFSAHFDYNSSENKFGFDKIVFVCDLKNIRKIFGHIYGGEVDFNGYIDKFYSKTVFNFKNHYNLCNWIDDKVELFNYSSKGPKIMFSRDNKDFLYDILRLLIEENYLNFRNVLKANTNSLINNLNKIETTSNNHPFVNCELVKVAFLMLEIFGDYSALLDTLEKMNQSQGRKIIQSAKLRAGDIQSYYNYYMIPLLQFKNHGWRENKDFNLVIDDKNYGTYKLIDKYGAGLIAEPSLHISYPDAMLRFWSNLRKCFIILHEHSVIK